MLPEGFSLSSFSRMREPFRATILCKGTKEVLPMQCRIFCGNSVKTLVPFPDGLTGYDPQVLLSKTLPQGRRSILLTESERAVTYQLFLTQQQP